MAAKGMSGSAAGTDTPATVVPDVPVEALPLEGTTDAAPDVTPPTVEPTAAADGKVTVLASRPTRPPSENARPSNLVPAPSVMSWSARIVPTIDVDGARTALPPTCQRT
jgi:hypothetical protein